MTSKRIYEAIKSESVMAGFVVRSDSYINKLKYGNVGGMNGLEHDELVDVAVMIGSLKTMCELYGKGLTDINTQRLSELIQKWKPVFDRIDAIPMELQPDGEEEST